MWYNVRMKIKHLVLLAAGLALAGSVGAATADSKTTYVRDALQKYVDSGELPGAISVLYNDGVQETACVGYADVAKKRPIKLDDPYMQCSQTKGFCGVTVAMLVKRARSTSTIPSRSTCPSSARCGWRRPALTARAR